MAKTRLCTRWSGASAWFFRQRPRFFAFCGPFPRCQMCRSLRLSNRQVDESPKRTNFKPSKYMGVLLRGRGKVISHSDRYSVFKVQWKDLSLVPTGKCRIIGCFWKDFFILQKTPSLIWTKGAEMHTHFRAFSEKTFWKIYPFTYSHWKKPNAPPKWENISEWKTSSLIWTKGAEMHTHFGASPKNFLRKFIPLLVPTGKYKIIGCFWKIFIW